MFQAEGTACAKARKAERVGRHPLALSNEGSREAGDENQKQRLDHRGSWELGRTLIRGLP